jgi:hypothetical protein
LTKFYGAIESDDSFQLITSRRKKKKFRLFKNFRAKTFFFHKIRKISGNGAASLPPKSLGRLTSGRENLEIIITADRM